MAKKKIILIIIAVIALVGIFVGAMLILRNNDKTAGNGNETSSTTSVDETTSSEPTDTSETSSDTPSTPTDSSQETPSITDSSTPSTSNPEQGKEAGRTMEEVMEDIVVLSDGKKMKVEDLVVLKDEDIVLDAEGGMNLLISYGNWANRLGIPEEDRIYFNTTIDGQKVVNCGGTMDSILEKNGYKNVYEISTYK